MCCAFGVFAVQGGNSISHSSAPKGPFLRGPTLARCLLYVSATPGQPGSPDREAVLLERSLTFFRYARCSRQVRCAPRGARLRPGPAVRRGNESVLESAVAAPRGGRPSPRFSKLAARPGRGSLRVERSLVRVSRVRTSPWEQRPGQGGNFLVRNGSVGGERPWGSGLRGAGEVATPSRRVRGGKSERARSAVYAVSRTGINIAVTSAGWVRSEQSRRAHRRYRQRARLRRAERHCGKTCLASRWKRGEPHGRQPGAIPRHARGGVSRRGGAKPRGRNMARSWLDPARRERQRSREWTPRASTAEGRSLDNPMRGSSMARWQHCGVER